MGQERHHSGQGSPSREPYGNDQLDYSSLAFRGHLSQSSSEISHLSPFSTFTLLRHSQTHTQRRCLEHISFFIHGDKYICSVPLFQLGINLSIGHASCNSVRLNSSLSVGWWVSNPGVLLAVGAPGMVACCNPGCRGSYPVVSASRRVTSLPEMNAAKH